MLAWNLTPSHIANMNGPISMVTDLFSWPALLKSAQKWVSGLVTNVILFGVHLFTEIFNCKSMNQSLKQLT